MDKDMDKKITIESLENYYRGQGCNCSAHGQCECGCDAEWRSKTELLVEAWYHMTPSEMRLRAGEMTAQEIRTVKAVLGSIIEQAKYKIRR